MQCSLVATGGCEEGLRKAFAGWGQGLVMVSLQDGRSCLRLCVNVAFRFQPRLLISGRGELAVALLSVGDGDGLGRAS
jgi:hypothetical protein